MGCDIHMVAQKRLADGTWETMVFPVAKWIKDLYNDGLPSYYTEPTTRVHVRRNYTLFSILADVRNDGTIRPISKPRGLPENLILNFDPNPEEGNDYVPDFPDHVGDTWIGEHSLSWVTLEEFLAWEWDEPMKVQGIVNISTYAELKATGKTPNSWCGGTNAEVVTESRANELINARNTLGRPVGEGREYVFTEWLENARKFTEDMWEEWIPLMMEREPDPSKIRLVFGFDS